MLAATLLSLSLSVLAPQGGLQLPPPPKNPGAVQPVQRPLSEIERFRRDLLELRGAQPKVEARLAQMAQDYPAIEPLLIEVGRKALPREMQDLMVAARRFGTRKVGDELLFQLLARPLAEATRDVLEVMVVLQGQDQRRALQECVRGRIAGVRRGATEILMRTATTDDLPFALELVSASELDHQLAGVDLLSAIADERAGQRLLQLLSREPTVAGAACAALIRARAVEPLLQCLREPPIDRSYAYAAFALLAIEDATGKRHLGAAHIDPLSSQLRQFDPLTRALAAVPLAELSYRSPGGDVANGRDADIVAALLEVVEPQAFVPNLDLLKRPAIERLVRFTGRITGAQTLSWRDWWRDQQATFVGVRSQVQVTEDNVAFVVLTSQRERRVVRLLGEGLADLPPLPGALEVLLTRERMLAVVRALESLGLQDVDALRPPVGLPLVQTLQLQVQGARTQVAAPAQASARFSALQQQVDQALDGELWQLFRHPTEEPDRGRFWRQERAFLAGNPPESERSRRFRERLLRCWPALSSQLRQQGLAWLFSTTDRNQLTEADGQQLLALARDVQPFDENTRGLLELACGAAGDQVWRDCIDLAHRAEGAGRPVVRKLFQLLGPDRVLAALTDPRPEVRRAALDEAVSLRDVRSFPRLLQMLEDPDRGVRQATVFAVGQLQVAAAQRPLIAMIASAETPPSLRRECLRALGRVGGEGAFAILQRAVLEAPAKEDRDAALRGLGELKDPRAAQLLAELVVIANGTETADLARFYLQRQGAGMAVPALRAQMQATSAERRAPLVLLLGRFQDPQAVPELIELLRQGVQPTEVVALLAGTTGLDINAANDRASALQQWWNVHRNEAQWQWLLQALAAGNVTTTLRPEQFQPGAGLVAVPELARLLVEAPAPRLAVLSSAVLRQVTGEDYGLVDPLTPVDVREGIATRYRMLCEGSPSAQAR